MSNIFFKPWIGKNYGTKEAIFSKRILILGDSHHCEKECSNCGVEQNKDRCENFTTEVINGYLDINHKASWKRTFSKFMNSFVANSVLEKSDRNELWDSLAFYNYLQVAAGNDNRQTHLYNYNEELHFIAFNEVLTSLEPDIIICWGNNVWDALPNDFGWGTAVSNDKFSNCHLIYPFKDQTIELLGITHPSTAYKSSYWSNVFFEIGANK